MSTVEFVGVSAPKGRARALALGGIATCGVVTMALFGLVLSGGDHPFGERDGISSAAVEVLPLPGARPTDSDRIAAELAEISPAAGVPARHRNTAAKKARKHDPSRSVGALLVRFEQAGYQLAAVRDDDHHVPRIYVQKLPTDLADLTSPQERKRVFIAAMLPLILRVNEEILADRERVLSLKSQIDAGAELSKADSSWLHAVAKRYEAGPYEFADLMQRMDIVPPSLALAQAAEESGWGTSRFAQEGNALFGQYTFKEGAGMEPLERSDDRQHFIKAYSSLIDTVRGYMHNLNYHRAYREFRQQRAALRVAGRPVTGDDLAKELKRYSERGNDYIRTLRQIIRVNALDRLDDARLQGEQWTRFDRPSTDRSS